MKVTFVDAAFWVGGEIRQLLKNKSTATKAHILKKLVQGISSRVLTTTSKAQQPPVREAGAQAEHHRGERLQS